VQENLPDLDAVFTKYRNIGARESSGFGRSIYRVSGYRCERISRIRTRYLQSIGVSVQENRARIPYLTCTVPMMLSRAQFVYARRARPCSVSRGGAVARWCAVRSCEPVGRDRYCARGAGAGENIQFCTRWDWLSVAFLVQSMQWPAVRLKGILN